MAQDAVAMAFTGPEPGEELREVRVLMEEMSQILAKTTGVEGTWSAFRVLANVLTAMMKETSDEVGGGSTMNLGTAGAGVE